MFIFSSILIYFSSIIIAISAMTFVVLATIVDEVNKRRQLFFLMCFCAGNFLIETLYLWMTVQDSLMHYYHYNTVMRVADTVLYTLQVYSWCRFMLYLPSRRSGSSVVRSDAMLCNIITGIALIIGVVNYSFFIDDQFLFKGETGVAAEVISTILLTIILIYIAATRDNKAIGRSHFNIYNLLITAALIIIQWWTCIFMIIETSLDLPFEIHEYLTGSVQQMFVIIITAMYVYRPDYSHRTLKERLTALIEERGAMPQDKPAAAGSAVSFSSAEASGSTAALSSDGTVSADDHADICSDTFMSSDLAKENEHTADTYTNFSLDQGSAIKDTAASIRDNAGVSASDLARSPVAPDNDPADSPTTAETTAAVPPDDAARIEQLFDEKQLTRREREVAKLAYAGLTNPEIADSLCISQYTVKRHMHSIFEKLNISARIELVHFMNGM